MKLSIPKIIHLCWLSGDPFPEYIQKCLDSWKKHLPDYEIWLWDTKRFDVNSTIWTRQAFERKKYAFVADYIRLYALYNHGGIYLDSDVLMYKSFNDLLSLPYFFGLDYTESFEAAVIGAQKGTRWIGDVLEHYENRRFVKEDGSLDMMPLPRVFLETLREKYKFYLLKRLEPYQETQGALFLFHQDFFNSRSSIGPRQTKRSYCAHFYAGSWCAKSNTWKDKIKRNIPRWLLKLIYDISHHTYKKKHIHRFAPSYEVYAR